jgi:DNA replication protein DnaC
MLKETLLSLRMFGAVEAMESFSRITDKSAYTEALLKAEISYRDERKNERLLKSATFPSEKEWGEIDKTLNPEIDFNSVQALGSGEFVRNKENLCLVGHQGTGKSHSLVALGRELCRKGVSVKFYTAHTLVTILEEAQDDHTLSKITDALLKPQLLIIDELGFVPFTKKGANLLFDVFAKRYEKGSIALSTNLTFDKWSSLFRSTELTAALLDRFTHKAHIFAYKGQSARFLESKKRQEKHKLMEQKRE